MKPRMEQEFEGIQLVAQVLKFGTGLAISSIAGLEPQKLDPSSEES